MPTPLYESKSQKSLVRLGYSRNQATQIQMNSLENSSKSSGVMSE